MLNLFYMDNYIVVGIDGTGSKTWLNGSKTNSHTYSFIQDFKGGAVDGISKQWFHGTSDNIADRESEQIIQNALDFILKSLRLKFPHKGISKNVALEMFDVSSCKRSEYYSGVSKDYEYSNNSIAVRNVATVVSDGSKQVLTTNDVKIILIGHSRGALATTVLAKMLSPIVKVYFMGMYDSVDRNNCLDSTTIENVKYVYHALRSPEINSRSMFGNSSTMVSSSVDEYIPKSFLTSHGGIGGDFVSNPKEVGFGGDNSCVPQPAKKYITTRAGTIEVDNTHPLTKKFNLPIDEICKQGRNAANEFVRNGAREKGLPI
jgi:hypothetical protein